MKKKFDNYNFISAMALCVLCALLFLNDASAQAEPKNKLVDFKAFGQWEIWCIDVAQSGTIECNLNQVLRYKNHPDFRAMIPRIFTDGQQITYMEIDREWQTGFTRGYIQVDNLEPVSLSDCGKPCVLKGDVLAKLIDQFSAGSQATIHFHDYLVEEFNIELSLPQFSTALETLKIMQSR